VHSWAEQTWACSSRSGDHLARARVTFGRLALQIFFAQLSRAQLGPSCFSSSSTSQDLAIFVENFVSYAIFSPNPVKSSIIWNFSMPLIREIWAIDFYSFCFESVAPSMLDSQTTLSGVTFPTLRLPAKLSILWMLNDTARTSLDVFSDYIVYRTFLGLRDIRGPRYNFTFW